ncbi:MAG: nucleotidyltransferase domain-containing protein [Thaumarchaeota archaeon]|nr:nucleotidyltransferase domain-containing protein [Nitrososphaerota archaeon]
MTLGNEERTVLAGVASSLADKSSIVAACLYGSKVAGYAKPDSDYDLIVVSKKFGEGVRYRYLSEPVALSALVVDEGLLWEDARTSYLGEFVVGRFLNVYEPLDNPDFFRSVELEYKRRVIVEALLALSSDYGEFVSHITIPYEYFLFDKLKKRSAVYPPALYSYVQTYGGPKAIENTGATVAGFRTAAATLVNRGFLVAEDDGVRVVPEKMKGDAFTTVQSLFSLTARGVTQYAIHGYAGRVGLSVFRKEAQSKIRRMRENFIPPTALERPRSLLRLREGRVISDASRLEKELGGFLGFKQFTTVEKFLGDPYSTTTVLTFREGEREESVVVKSFSDVRSLKWALLSVWAAAANRFSTAPIARLEREYDMTLRLRSSGVEVPLVIAVAPGERIMVKEFVRGPTLSTVIDGLMRGGGGSGLAEVAAYGELLAKVHAAGLAIGDTKAGNVVVSSRGLILTDLEQAVPKGDRSWDLAEFLYYTAKFSNRENTMRSVARTFLKSYSSKGEKSIIVKAASQKYVLPFQPFMTPGMSRMLKDEIASAS